MDTNKIQAFPPNSLVRKISLNRLKNLQKLSVSGKPPHQAITWRSLHFTLWNLQAKANSQLIDISNYSRVYMCLKK